MALLELQTVRVLRNAVLFPMNVCSLLSTPAMHIYMSCSMVMSDDAHSHQHRMINAAVCDGKACTSCCSKINRIVAHGAFTTIAIPLGLDRHISGMISATLVNDQCAFSEASEG